MLLPEEPMWDAPFCDIHEFRSPKVDQIHSTAGNLVIVLWMSCSLHLHAHQLS